MKTKIFCDSADYETIKHFNNKNIVDGFTTNPSLMRLSGAKNYRDYSLKILKVCRKKPISFEVFADDEKSMYKQAKEISTWGKNVYVKIPVTNTRGVGCYNLIKKLSNENIKLNVTAIFTNNQVTKVINSLNMNTKSIISIFAGRIADTGIDPSLLISFCLKNLKLKKNKKCEVLWASTREIYSIIAAEKLGCHIITVPNNILSKINLIGKNLNSYSLETIKDFYKDAKSAGFKI